MCGKFSTTRVVEYALLGPPCVSVHRLPSVPHQVDPADHDSWFVLVFSPEGGSLEEESTDGFEHNTTHMCMHMCMCMYMCSQPLLRACHRLQRLVHTWLQARTDGFEFIEPDTRGMPGG